MAVDYEDVVKTIADALREAFQRDLNITEYWPKGIVTPAAFIAEQTPAENFDMSFNGGLHEYKLLVRLAIGQVSDKSAQDRIRELISPRGPLVPLLNDIEIGTGFVHVTQAVREQVPSGTGLLAGARLLVTVVA